MTTVRRLVAVATIAPIVSMSALAVASPAQAVARLDIPPQVTSNRTVTLSGTVDLLFDAFLFVDGRQVAKGDHKVSYPWNPRDRPNGNYEIKLEQRGKVLGSEWHQTSKTLMQAVPPATPSGVDARLQGDQIVVTWDKGSEPDLQGYEVATSQTGKVGSVQVDSACSGGSCKAILAVPAKTAGQRVGFTVRALRGNGSGGILTSGGSDAASVNVPAVKVPQTSQNADTQKSTTQQDAGKSTGGQQDGKTSGKKNDKQSGVQDLPQLPAKKPATAPIRQPKTAAVPTKAPKPPDEAKNSGDTALPPAKADKNAAKTKVMDGTESVPDSGVIETDIAPATSTNITAQSADSSTGGMSQYGVFIAGGLILLLLGAHGGAWFRRKLLAAGAGAGAGAAGAGAGAARIPSSGDDDAPKGEDIGAATIATPTIAATTDAVTTVSASMGAVTAGVAPTNASATVVSRRPAVILAVVKTRRHQPVPVEPFSGSHGPAQSVPAQQVVTQHGPVQHGPAQSVPAQPILVHDGRFHEAPVGWEPVSGSVSASWSEPVRLVLPVEVAHPGARPVAHPEASVATPAAVPIDDRWDDYLPPAPRSMEDSGFWERPQPGAADFWAADQDDPSYPGGRHGSGGI